MTASVWRAAHVAAIDQHTYPAFPVIDCQNARRVLPDIDLWDLWPVQEMDGRVADIAGGTLIMLLSAPRQADPDERHAHARIRLMHWKPTGWTDLGLLLPEGLNPGSREWAGSAIVSADHKTITLFFTAAGSRDGTLPSYAQRLLETTASIRIEQNVVALTEWSKPVESVVADGATYMRDLNGGGAIGTIKAFRDPFYFRDPTDGVEYLVFSASLASSPSLWNGAIGAARRGAQGWELLAPLISASGVNNELERPHIVTRDDLYYLFWSTQRKVFAEDGPNGPNGLYGMVASTIDGPWRPLNETGLVVANPLEAPLQAYSWLVLSDLRVLSFIDMVCLGRAPFDAIEAREHFGGTPAPIARIRLIGDRSTLEFAGFPKTSFALT